MKITSPNPQGQIVIPAKIRKSLGITDQTMLKIYVRDKTICMEPLEIDLEKESTEISFPKEKHFEDFHFDSLHPEEKNLAGKIDHYLYHQKT